MAENRKTPAIRFKGFIEAWEQRKLRELCVLFTDGDWIESKDQSDSGVRLVQTGNIGVAEFLDKTNNQKWITEETFKKLNCEEVLPGDILISRLPEPAGRACIMPFLGVKVITAVDCTIARTASDCSNKFLLQYLSSQNHFNEVNTALAGGTRQRISRSNLSGFNIPTPASFEEQEAIGEYFENLDNLITLHQRKLLKIKNIKKAMLEKMFPQNGQSTPEIRFNGFLDAWEQHKLFDILVQRIEHQKITEDAPLLAFSYAEGVINPEDKKSNKRDFIMTDKYNKIFSRTEKNDIIYNPANVIHGAIHRNKLGTGVVSPIYKIFKCEKASPKFVGERLHTDKFIEEITKYIEGTVIKLRTLSPEQFLDMSIEIPSSYDEQEKIGTYFQGLDNLITLHQRKLDKLNNIKKACLEKMFI